MDPTIQRFMALIESTKKSNFPWKREEPYNQPYYSFSSQNKVWQKTDPREGIFPQTSSTYMNFSVLSWNIDFMLPFEKERMTVALAYLEKLVSPLQRPCIVFLQEMTISDLELIQSQSWIQKEYHVTDIDTQYWESGYYGTCTLIPKSLHVLSVFRVHYDATKMERDGLFVDVKLGDDQVLRLCNTHLESLIAEPPLRPRQVQTAARYMHEKSINFSVLGGDLNAIQPFDRALHSDNNLNDAYLAVQGKEDSEEGYTWGQMAAVNQRERFGCSRMDKLFYRGDLKVVNFERFGLGLAVKEDALKEKLMSMANLDGGWITDHLGVKGDFTIGGNASVL